MTETIHVKLRVINAYELYPTEITYPEADVPAPPRGDAAGWEWDWLHPLTGVGHSDGDSFYDVEVLESSCPDLLPVGYTCDFGY